MLVDGKKKNLSLMHKPAKRLRVKDLIPVALELRSVRTLGIRIISAACIGGQKSTL